MWWPGTLLTVSVSCHGTDLRTSVVINFDEMNGIAESQEEFQVLSCTDMMNAGKELFKWRPEALPGQKQSTQDNLINAHELPSSDEELGNEDDEILPEKLDGIYSLRPRHRKKKVKLEPTENEAKVMGNPTPYSTLHRKVTMLQATVRNMERTQALTALKGHEETPALHETPIMYLAARLNDLFYNEPVLQIRRNAVLGRMHDPAFIMKTSSLEASADCTLSQMDSLLHFLQSSIPGRFIVYPTQEKITSTVPETVAVYLSSFTDMIQVFTGQAYKPDVQEMLVKWKDSRDTKKPFIARILGHGVNVGRNSNNPSFITPGVSCAWWAGGEETIQTIIREQSVYDTTNNRFRFPLATKHLAKDDYAKSCEHLTKGCRMQLPCVPHLTFRFEWTPHIKQAYKLPFTKSEDRRDILGTIYVRVPYTRVVGEYSCNELLEQLRKLLS